MASFFFFSPNTNTPTLSHPTLFFNSPSPLITTPPKHLSWFSRQHPRRALRLTVPTTRAGANANSYVIAAVLPLSLLAITVFTSIRVADRLDEKFLQEIAMDEAIREADDGDSDGENSSESEPVLTRTRNRPKREA